jgi:ATP-dependent helicase/nuclease subunit B
MVKASDYLYIFCPETDGVNTLHMSPVFDRMEKMFKDAYLDRSVLENYISTEEAMFNKAVKAVYEAGNGHIKNAKDYALSLWYKDKQGYKGILESAGSTDYYGNERLSAYSIDMIYGENTKTSVSRLERFVECPFSFFVKYSLEAEDRQSYHIQRVDLGNLFHEILEIFARIVRAKDLSWSGLSYEKINEIVDLAYVQINETRKSDLFINEARSRFILERTKKIAKTSIWALCKHISAGSFKPFETEMDFGITSPVTGIEIQVGRGRTFTLTGRIDRIDILDTEGEAYVKIIDYKTGNTKFDITDIYYGMQLQLLLYMNALVKNGAKILNLPKDPKAGGIFYFNIQNPLAEYIDEAGENREKINELLLSQFKMSGLVLNKNEVIKGLDSEFEKNSPVIPVTVNAKGEYASRSNALAGEEDFMRIMGFAENKVREIGNSILAGDIEPKPYKKGAYSGCDYCSYNAICAFEAGSGGFKYNYLYKKAGLSDLK